MAAANARRAVEQEKLHTWCARVGIESASDLAFWFTSYDQALHEAGRAVADGWDLARLLLVWLQYLFAFLFGGPL